MPGWPIAKSSSTPIITSCHHQPTPLHGFPHHLLPPCYHHTTTYTLTSNSTNFTQLILNSECRSSTHCTWLSPLLSSLIAISAPGSHPPPSHDSYSQTCRPHTSYTNMRRRQ